MNKLVLKGRCRQTGQLVEVDNLTRFTLESSLDSPAATFWGKSHWGVTATPPPSLSHLYLQQGATTLFSGEVDEQTTTLGAQGVVLELEARSKGAALLDNETPPGTLYNVNMSTAFSLLGRDLGFSGHFFPLGHLAQFTFHKGKSRWQDLTDFLRALTGGCPFCVGGDIYFAPPQGTKEWMVSNTFPGENFTQFRHISAPYKVVSKVFLQDREGYYSASLTNPLNHRYPSRRERYFIPPKEIGASYQKGAAQILADSALEAERYVVDLPTFLHPQLGDKVSFKQDGFQLHHLNLAGYRLQMGPEGPSTRLHLQHALL